MGTMRSASSTEGRGFDGPVGGAVGIVYGSMNGTSSVRAKDRRKVADRCGVGLYAKARISASAEALR